MARIGLDARMCAYRTGGIASYTRQLAAALAPVLAERGHHFVVGHARRFEPVVPRQPRVRHPALSTPSHHRLEPLALPIELLPWRCGLIHSPDFIPPRLGPWRSVITVHDLDFVRHPERLTTEARRYYGQIGRAVRQADAIIAVSAATRDDLTTLLDVPFDRIVIIHEAADAIYRPVDANCQRSNGNPPYFLAVGTIEPRKNYETLIAAYRAYREAATDPRRLIIVGSEGWNSAETVAHLRAEPGIEWHGPASPEELVALYHGATALLTPSWDEGFGLPVVEAMASGTPAAISAARALAEIAGDAALVAPPDDARAWAALMTTLASDPSQRRELRARGLARAAQFSWQRAAMETANVYERVLARSKRERGTRGD